MLPAAGNSTGNNFALVGAEVAVSIAQADNLMGFGDIEPAFVPGDAMGLVEVFGKDDIFIRHAVGIAVGESNNLAVTNSRNVKRRRRDFKVRPGAGIGSEGHQARRGQSGSVLAQDKAGRQALVGLAGILRRARTTRQRQYKRQRHR